jgi:hypothetical protein
MPQFDLESCQMDVRIKILNDLNKTHIWIYTRTS